MTPNGGTTTHILSLLAVCAVCAVWVLSLPAHALTSDGWVVTWGTAKTAAARQAELAILGYTEKTFYPLSNISWVSKVADTAVAPDTRFSPNYVGQLFNTTPNDPSFTNALAADDLAQQYINLPKAWDYNQGSNRIRIGILDSGIDTDHPDLINKIDAAVSFAPDGTSAFDKIGHGTSVASLIAAEANNGNGIAGVCWSCRIVAIKVVNDTGNYTTASLAEGLRWAAENNVNIINMSLGRTGSGLSGSNYSDPVELAAIQYADAQGILLIASAGNAGNQGVEYPARYGEVMAVGAIDVTTGLRAVFSNYKDDLEIMAPGVDMFADSVDASNIAIPSGTSFSAPLVAGVAGLVWSEQPTLTRGEVRSRLNSSAKDLDIPGSDDQTGNGCVDAAAALRVAAFAVSTGKDVVSFPNPYRVRAGGSVTIRPPQDAGILTVKLYSMDGRLLRVLSGTNEVLWDGKTTGGQIVPAGVYLFQASGTNVRDEGRVTVIDW